MEKQCTIDKRILEEIRDRVPADKYGHKDSLWKPLYFDSLRNCPAVIKNRGDCKEGYDCIDSSLAVMKILQEHGMKSKMAYGVSEDGIFSSTEGHKFVITQDGQTVDGVPLYPIVGARHKVNGTYVQESLGNIRNIVDINRVIIDFRESNGCKYLISGNVNNNLSNRKDKISGDVAIGISRNGKSPEEGYMVVAYINRDDLRGFLKSQGSVGKNFRQDEAIERLEELESKNIVLTEEFGWDNKQRPNGKLDYKFKDTRKIGDDLRKELEKNMKEFVHLIETTPFIRLYDGL